MKITIDHRKRLKYYLDEFYKRYKHERYTIFHFVKFFKLRLKNNKDAWMGVCGDTGSGKSLFAVMSMVLFGRPMNLIDNIAYVPRGNEIINKFEKLNFQTLLIDEAAREMRAVNWQSKQQQGVNIKAMTDRFKNNWVFLNMPSFREFTKSMRLGNIQFRTIIPYRTNLYARVILQRKSRNWRSEDPWGDDEANKKYERSKKRYGDISNEIILKVERSIPNTVMDFIIPNLELILPEITNEYDRLKHESRDASRLLDETSDNKNRWRDEHKKLLQNICKIMYYNKLGIGKVRVSKKDMAKTLGISPATFNKYLEMEIKENQKSDFRKQLA